MAGAAVCGGVLCGFPGSTGTALRDVSPAVRILPGKAKGPLRRVGLHVYAGDNLISHTVTRAVPSAQRDLTSVFGMGTGVALVIFSPANCQNSRIDAAKFHD